MSSDRQSTLIFRLSLFLFLSLLLVTVYTLRLGSTLSHSREMVITSTTKNNNNKSTICSRARIVHDTWWASLLYAVHTHQSSQQNVIYNYVVFVSHWGHKFSIRRQLLLLQWEAHLLWSKSPDFSMGIAQSRVSMWRRRRRGCSNSSKSKVYKRRVSMLI